jgi:hypothetical protein
LRFPRRLEESLGKHGWRLNHRADCTYAGPQGMSNHFTQPAGINGFHVVVKHTNDFATRLLDSHVVDGREIKGSVVANETNAIGGCKPRQI